MGSGPGPEALGPPPPAPCVEAATSTSSDVMFVSTATSTSGDVTFVSTATSTCSDMLFVSQVGLISFLSRLVEMAGLRQSREQRSAVIVDAAAEFLGVTLEGVADVMRSDRRQ